MNIAVSSVSDSLDGEVDQRFGRARYFVIINDESNTVRVVDNDINLQLPSGAGIQTASRLVKEGIKVVLTGHCGPKAYQVLCAADVDVYLGVEGRISDAVERYRQNRLVKADSYDVEGHWF